MELKELMKKLEISEDYIIEAAQKMNEIHKRCTCEECPLNTEYGCATTTNAIIRVDEAVKKRIQKLMHHNYMDDVAEMLGVKIGEHFKIAYNNEDIVSGFHLEQTGLYCDESLRAPVNLTELLAGKAYIVKEE